MASIKLTTGLKVYDIEDEQGNVRGQIKFNPSDVNLFPRALKMVTNVQNYMQEVKLAEGKEDITDEDIAKMIEDYDNTIKTEINKLFDDDNTSNVVFGNQNCLNILDGVTFVERFITAIMPIIEADTKEAIKASNARIDAYTKQVSK